MLSNDNKSPPIITPQKQSFVDRFASRKTQPTDTEMKRNPTDEEAKVGF